MGNTHGEPQEKSQEVLSSEVKSFISAGLSEELALRLASSCENGSMSLSSIKDMSANEMKTKLGITEEDARKLHSYWESYDEFVILEIATMGGNGPLQEALLSSGAFEGKNPGESEWNSLLKSRVFKAAGDGCFDHIELDEDTSLQVVEASVVKKKKFV